MKNKIIKWLGGYTSIEIEKMRLENLALKIFAYRAGDLVYIKNRKHDPFQPYYLIESYNGGTCWYISTNKEKKSLSIDDGVSYKVLSFTKPSICPCCHKPT